MVTKGAVEVLFRTVIESIAGAEDEPVFLGADSEEQQRPCTVAECFHLEEEPKDTGNYFASVRVRVKSPADKALLEDGETLSDPVADHNARVELILGNLKVAELGQLLRDAGTMQVDDTVEDLGIDPEIDGRSFVDGFMWRIYCSKTKWG